MTCYACHKDKPLSDFHKDKSRRSGHAYICKQCDKMRARVCSPEQRVYRARAEKERRRLRRELRPSRTKPFTPITLKVCTRCKQEKNLSEFHRKTANKSTGVRSICKECSREIYAKTKTTCAPNPNIVLVKGTGRYAETLRTDGDVLTIRYEGDDMESTISAKDAWVV